MGERCQESLTGMGLNYTGEWDGPRYSEAAVLKLQRVKESPGGFVKPQIWAALW